MGSLCEAAYSDGTYDHVKSFDDIRQTLKSNGEGREVAEAKWWSQEKRLLRLYLVTECWEGKKEERSQMAAKVWTQIPVALREKIKNEMARLQLSCKVMRGC